MGAIGSKRIVFVSRPDEAEPWYSDLAAALPEGFILAEIDGSMPLAAQFQEVQIVVDNGGHATPAMIEAAADAGVCLWVAMTTGVDQLDIDALRERGIRVTNTPGQFSAVALAEHALMLMLALAKQLGVARRNLANGVMHKPVGRELAGAVLGLVGFGQSGRELCRRAAALGMRVRAIDQISPSQTEAGALGLEWFAGDGALPQLLEIADFVSLHVPLNADTRHMIGAAELELMQPSAYLINVARGELVDERALTDALERGTIAGAGIDVFSTEPPDPSNRLLHLPTVLSTPHVAGVTDGTSRRRAAACAENVRRFGAGEPLLYEVG